MSAVCLAKLYLTSCSTIYTITLAILFISCMYTVLSQDVGIKVLDQLFPVIVYSPNAPSDLISQVTQMAI
jgi:hypothetical protein